MLLKLVPTGSTRLPRYASCCVNKLERMSVKKKKRTEPSTWKVNLCFPRMDSRAQIRASFSEKLHQSSACRLPSFQGNIPRYTWLLLSCVQELFCPGIVFWIRDGVLFRYSVMEISSNVVRLAHSVTKQNQGETVKLISARAHSKHLLLFFPPQHKHSFKQNDGKQKQLGSQEFTMASGESRFQRRCAHDLDARCQDHYYWDQARTTGCTSFSQLKLMLKV